MNRDYNTRDAFIMAPVPDGKVPKKVCLWKKNLEFNNHTIYLEEQLKILRINKLYNILPISNPKNRYFYTNLDF